MEAKERSVTIVVPCRNEIRRIRRFLDSLFSQETGGLDVEIIVADGMSDDGTRGVLAETQRRIPALRVVDNPERIVSTGLNRAIRQARGQIIVRMDAHTEYAPDYVQTCVATLLETGADNVGGPPRTRADGHTSELIAAAFHSPFATGGARWHDPGHTGYVDTVPFGCWRKSTLERLGLFDETLVRNQDDELNYRLIKAGGRIWQSPKMLSWYSPRGTLWATFRQQFQYGFWKVAVLRKHGTPASWRHLAPGTFVLANFGLLLAWAAAGAAGCEPVSKALLGTWTSIAASYALFCLIGAVAAGRRRNWRLIPLLPAVFAVYHFGYGSGFLAGVAHWLGRGADSAPRAATSLTR